MDDDSFSLQEDALLLDPADIDDVGNRSAADCIASSLSLIVSTDASSYNSDTAAAAAAAARSSLSRWRDSPFSNRIRDVRNSVDDDCSLMRNAEDDGFAFLLLGDDGNAGAK